MRLTASEREQLEKWSRTRTASHRVVVRARIVLLRSTGLGMAAIATQLHVSPTTVRLWCKRFTERGLAALTRDASGRGRPRGGDAAMELAVLRASQACVNGSLSVRQVASRAKASPTTVWRVWQRYRLGRNTPRQTIDAVLEQLISGTSEAPR